MFAYVLIELESKDVGDILEKIKKNRRVKEAHVLFGEWDIIMKVDCQSPEDLATYIIESVRPIKGIKLTSTMIVAK